MTIKTITASSNNKTESYRLLNMIHAMAMQEASASKTWQLKSTATNSAYVMTTMTNGTVDVIAESRFNHHIYTMKAAED